MKGIILLNGEPYSGVIEDENAYVLCADGGYNWAKGRVRIDENSGDFDSVSGTPFPPPSKVYPSQKNFTDGELALERMFALAAEKKIERIEIYGGGGGREDHFLGNLHLLYRTFKEKIPTEMITNHAKISVQSGKILLKNIKNKTISLLPMGGDAHIMVNKGLFYPTDDLTLFYGSCRGISNVGTDETAEIICDAGALLVIVNNG